MLDWLAKAPLVGKKIGKGADKLHEVASGMREAGKRNEEAAGDLLAPAVDKTTTPALPTPLTPESPTPGTTESCP